MEKTDFRHGPYCNLMSDVAFRWIFTKESNKTLLRDFLNELITDREITDVELYKDCQMPYSKEYKKSVFDVSCKTSTGIMIDVEVQLSKQDWFSDRCLYYSTFNIQKQVKESSKEYFLKPVYVVSIDNFTRSHSEGWDGRIRSSYSLREDECHELMTDNLHFIFIELDRFDKKWEDIETETEKIYFCIKHLHEYETLPDKLATGLTARIAEQSKLCEMPPEIKDIYISRMETEIDKRAQLLCAIREGKAEGRAEGRAELLRTMLANGMDINMLASATGLSIEQIEACCK